jgi:hypothetical protein
MNRKNFLFSSAATAGAFLITPALYQNRPTLDLALIKEFVGAAHKDFDKVKQMLTETPDLLHAVNNLGAWDWEDAIGAAGHVGHRELTLYLLEKGARPTICVAAMLGKTEVVKAFITAYPYMKNAVGPHRIPLMAHARKGGKDAEPVVEYLKSLGLQ